MLQTVLGWISAACIALSALVQAIDAMLKDAKKVRELLAVVVDSGVWPYVPIVLVSAGALTWIVLQVLTKWFDGTFRWKKHVRENFVNEVVPLDGHEYCHCTFRNVTLLYKGKTPPKFSNNDFLGSVGLKVTGRTVSYTVALLHELGMLNDKVPVQIGPERKAKISPPSSKRNRPNGN
jgi:hypothetical protein